MPIITSGNVINSTNQISPGVIVNSDINSTAAIAYSKLALTGAITFADLAAAGIITSAEGISGNNVDDAIPTAAAVKAYADAAAAGGAKEFWIPLQMFTGNVFPFNGTNNGMPSRSGMSLNNDVWFSFRVPDDFSSLDSALFIGNDGSGGNHTVDFTAAWGALGEAADTGSGSASNVSSSSGTFNILRSWSFAAAISGIAAGDYVGVSVNCDDTNEIFIGAWIKYNPA